MMNRLFSASLKIDKYYCLYCICVVPYLP
ncbi:protein of unknown function [Burkholderia multivorans]